MLDVFLQIEAFSLGKPPDTGHFKKLTFLFLNKIVLQFYVIYLEISK